MAHQSTRGDATGGGGLGHCKRRDSCKLLETHPNSHSPWRRWSDSPARIRAPTSLSRLIHFGFCQEINRIAAEGFGSTSPEEDWSRRCYVCIGDGERVW